MDKIKYYMSLVKQYYKINIKSIAVYEKDFYFGIVAMMIEYLASFVVIFFLYDSITDINGFTLYQLLLLQGINLVGFSLWSCFFVNTISLSYYIRMGELDRFLLRPVSPMFQIMMSGFDEDAWGELVVGLIIFFVAYYNLQLKLYLLIFIPIIFISSCLIYAGISILFSTISFFAIGQSDFANVVMDVKEFAKYPMSIYNKSLKIIFTTVVPIGFVAYYPSMIFFENKIFVVFITFFVSIVFYILSNCIWYAGLKRYGSTGS